MSNCKVVVLGDGAVGKTSLVCRLFRWGFSENYTKTIGIDYHPLKVHDKLTLNIWDVSGEERFRHLYPSYLRGANIVIYCIDLNTEFSEEMRKQIEDIKVCLPGVPLILAATKCDTYAASAQQRLNEIGQLVGSNANIITSAATGQGIGDENQPPLLIDLITSLRASPATIVNEEIIETVTASLIPEALAAQLLTSLHNGHATYYVTVHGHCKEKVLLGTVK